MRIGSHKMAPVHRTQRLPGKPSFASEAARLPVPHDPLPSVDRFRAELAARKICIPEAEDLLEQLCTGLKKAQIDTNSQNFEKHVAFLNCRQFAIMDFLLDRYFENTGLTENRTAFSTLTEIEKDAHRILALQMALQMPSWPDLLLRHLGIESNFLEYHPPLIKVLGNLITTFQAEFGSEKQIWKKQEVSLNREVTPTVAKGYWHQTKPSAPPNFGFFKTVFQRIFWEITMDGKTLFAYFKEIFSKNYSYKHPSSLRLKATSETLLQRFGKPSVLTFAKSKGVLLRHYGILKLHFRMLGILNQLENLNEAHAEFITDSAQELRFYLSHYFNGEIHDPNDGIENRVTQIENWIEQKAMADAVAS